MPNLPSIVPPPVPSLPSLDEHHEFHLHLVGREWAIRHAGMVLSYAEEAAYLRALHEKRNNIPYGIALWPAAVALAHELAALATEGALAGKRVLELGAGTGLPGIVAAALGAAAVVQTDSSEIALDLCRRNGRENGVMNIVYRRADWDG
ncbi:MAG: 50S ribosomal protein L11 methyltransferase [Fibrella sp.]|nr:50S ribosomal protein L11 methyltransferase [Armatimonadota bacterium]